MSEMSSSSDIKKNIEDLRKDVCAKKDRTPVYHIGIILAVSCDLLSGLLIGAAIGYVVYKYFLCHVIFIGLFVLLGGLAGLLNMYKTLRRFEKDNKDA